MYTTTATYNSCTTDFGGYRMSRYTYVLNNPLKYTGVFNNFIVPNAEMQYSIVKNETTDYEIASAYFNPSGSNHSPGAKQPTCKVSYRKAALDLTGFSTPPFSPTKCWNSRKTRNPLKTFSYLWKINGVWKP